MKKQALYISGALFSLIILIVISTLTFSFILHVRPNNDAPISQEPDTVYVYVSAETESVTDSEESKDAYLIKEHNEKIGIFDKYGDLIKTIDVYTKTLPKNDRIELQEGFWVCSEKELYSIIEAYSD